MQKTNDTYSFYTRFNGPDSGFCRLCGKKRVLTLDHIPPTSWINTHNIVLQSFLDKKQSMKSDSVQSCSQFDIKKIIGFPFCHAAVFNNACCLTSDSALI
jgi:hypothetical protein